MVGPRPSQGVPLPGEEEAMARTLVPLFAILVAVGAALAAPSPAAAATLNATCGDSGQPSQLRQLMVSANADDTIVMPTCTMTLTGGAMQFNKDLKVQGAGQGLTIIDGGGAHPVFVNSYQSVVLQ